MGSVPWLGSESATFQQDKAAPVNARLQTWRAGPMVAK
jgi:hypothetical protein